jgi:hypothetical protein
MNAAGTFPEVFLAVRHLILVRERDPILLECYLVLHKLLLFYDRQLGCHRASNYPRTRIYSA